MIEYDTTDGLVEHLHRLTSQASVFLEVGAYEAEFSHRVAAERPDASVLALEANPYNCAAQPLAGDVEALLAKSGLVPVARDFEYPYQHNVIFCRG